MKANNEHANKNVQHRFVRYLQSLSYTLLKMLKYDSALLVTAAREQVTVKILLKKDSYMRNSLEAFICLVCLPD